MSSLDRYPIKRIIEHPKYKYIRYEKNILYTANNIDSDVLDEDSQFMLGSVTKILTILTLLVLQQHKLINLNDPIKTYIISRNNMDVYSAKIYDLMNHETGLKIHPSNTVTKKYSSATDVLSEIDDQELKIDANKIGNFNYSNIGFIILGAIIEKVTNMTYIEAFKIYLFKPLGMKNTDVGNTNIQLYIKHETNYIHLTKTEFNERYFASSAGAFYSTLNDVIKLSYGISKILNNESLNILKTLYIYKKTDSESQIISHNGSIYGGYCDYSIEYDNDWKVKDIFFKCSTCD
jgi:CubicO group peptidase (beta-lactamase class C family)